MVPTEVRRRVRLAWPGLLALLTALPLAAQSLRVLQPAPLRAERGGDAATLQQLASGQTVTLLQMSGGWVRVQAGSLQGWLRASQVELPGAEVSDTSQRESGRRAAGATAVTLGVRALPPRNGRHALIVGVGNYLADPARPVPALAGVGHDMDSALAIAQRLQVPLNQVTLLRDADATRAGVQQALKDLETRVQPGDRVFIYWSGHGSRYFDASAGGCVETLVPYDLKDIGNREFAQWIQPLAAKADKMMVVYDACHSGGIGAAKAASRGLIGSSGNSSYTPKFTPGVEACQQPTNMRTRSWDAATQAVGVSGQDVVHLSSSRSDEVSFDNASSGGLATSSLRQCMEGDAKDLDGSGAITIDEIAACAQAKIGSALRGQTGLEPHHLVVSGNHDFVPLWFAEAAPPGATPAVPVPAPVPVPGPVPAPAAPVAATPTPTQPAPPTPPAATTPVPVPVPAVLAQIHAQRDSKRRVDVTLARPRLRIGTDMLDFSVTSSHAGYVYVALLGSDRQSLYLLFPNDLDRQNRIEAGASLQLPRPTWRVGADGPKGDDTLLVMVTDAPRDIAALGGAKAGPFSTPLTDAGGRARLQWLLGQHGPDCQGSHCADAFGSALLKVEEF